MSSTRSPPTATRAIFLTHTARPAKSPSTVARKISRSTTISPTLPNGDKVFRLKIVATETGGTAPIRPSPRRNSSSTSSSTTSTRRRRRSHSAPPRSSCSAKPAPRPARRWSRPLSPIRTAQRAATATTDTSSLTGLRIKDNFTIDPITGAITTKAALTPRRMTARCSVSSPSTSANPPWRLRRLTSLSICCSVPPTSSSRPSAAPPSILLKTSSRATSSELWSRPTMDLPASSSAIEADLIAVRDLEVHNAIDVARGHLGIKQEDIRAIAACREVHATPAGEGVVPAISLEGVIAAARPDHVRRSSPVDPLDDDVEHVELDLFSTSGPAPSRTPTLDLNSGDCSKSICVTSAT